MGRHENLTNGRRVPGREVAMQTKPIQVPDLTDPAARDDIRRECAEINRRDAEGGIMAWLGAICADDERDVAGRPAGSGKGDPEKE